ncbi:hypothetical protein RHMOL_Rhmol05G0105100 [Rhododendron molle]|uniref:Uncharacterized protein n=1 Tax=Rhododendron molle TaxID=49168 RepID=A0ACC0NMN0_RHOML|nr:hypothetical protein RHMOL_Rhmol05G0105100 [Rhododendron molle]
MIDELHLIGGQGGPIVEVIVSRMRYMANQAENKIRIVALSTSLANAKDLGEWIGATSNALFNFPPGVRPIGKPAIVFVPTRKHARYTAEDLMMYSSVDSGEKPMFLLQSGEKLEPFLSRIKEPMLSGTLRYGVGYLHEGLSSTDQDIVKTLFETGGIQVCVMSSAMC